jgi:hypothetical protein
MTDNIIQIHTAEASLFLPSLAHFLVSDGKSLPPLAITPMPRIIVA